MAAQQFADFLQLLSTDANVRSEFERDPQRVARQAGLSESQIAALASKDPKRVGEVLQSGGSEFVTHGIWPSVPSTLAS